MTRQISLMQAATDEAPASGSSNIRTSVGQTGGTVATTQAATTPADPNSTPARDLSISDDGLQSIFGSEGTEYRYYNDPGGNNCTWGTGFLAHLGPCSDEELGRQVTSEMVSAEQRRRVATAENAVRDQLGNTPITQAQYDAAVSYAYNLGAAGARTALAAIREGRNADAASTIRAHTAVTERGPDGHPLLDDRGRHRMAHPRGLRIRREREAAPFDPQPTQNAPAPGVRQP